MPKPVSDNSDTNNGKVVDKKSGTLGSRKVSIDGKSLPIKPEASSNEGVHKNTVNSMDQSSIDNIIDVKDIDIETLVEENSKLFARDVKFMLKKTMDDWDQAFLRLSNKSLDSKKDILGELKDVVKESKKRSSTKENFIKSAIKKSVSACKRFFLKIVGLIYKVISSLLMLPIWIVVSLFLISMLFTIIILRSIMNEGPNPLSVSLKGDSGFCNRVKADWGLSMSYIKSIFGSKRVSDQINLSVNEGLIKVGLSKKSSAELLKPILQFLK